MHYKTKGIVLHQVKYSESSIIVKVYTELFGLRSFIFKGVRKKKSSLKTNIFQPLSLIELVVNHKEKSSIQYVKEVRCILQFATIPFEIRKSSMALFMNELLYKTIKEEEANKPLFDFLYNSIVALDEAKDNYADFHLYFTVHLTKHLGFAPSDNYSEECCYFNLHEGMFQNVYSDETYYVNKQLSQWIYEIAKTTFNPVVPSPLSQHVRRKLLKTMILYYQIHQTTLKDINSHQVLEEVFN